MKIQNPSDDSPQISHKETLKNLYDKEYSFSSAHKKRRATLLQQKASENQNEGTDYVRDLCRRNIRKTYINLFIRKLKQVIVRENEMDHPLLEDEKKQHISCLQSIKLSLNFQIILNCGIIIQFLLMFFYSTLVLAFNEVKDTNIISKIALFCLCIQVFQIICKVFF